MGDRMKNRGFTLIELLVAITILATIAVLGWKGLDTIVRSRLALNAEMEQTRGLLLAFAQMQRDCSRMPAAGSIGERSSIAVQSGRLTLIRTVAAENQPNRLQVVTYQIQNGVLSRRESPATRTFAELDQIWANELTDKGTAQQVELQTGVGDMAFRMWDSKAIAWRTGEGATSSSNPPTGLEVALSLNGRPGKMVKVFLLGAV